MDFYTENSEKDNKTKKISKIILISIFILIILIIAIIFVILNLQSSQFRIIIDGETISNVPDDLFVIDEQTGKVYVSIKDFASYTNTGASEENEYAYVSHDGEYKLDIQDTTKCYIENNYETASFFLNSNKVCKLEKESTDDYEVYEISEQVRDIYNNGKLYILSEGIEIGFNLKFTYNKDKNNITIMTLPYLLDQYNEALVDEGYDEIDSNFNNQKAVLYNLFVTKRENGSEYGVLDNKLNEVINIRYRQIEFNENKKEFFVTNSSGNVGIFLSNGATKINLVYDEIKMIDNGSNSGLYLVKSNNKYGVIDDKDVKVIYPEYDKIGIDLSTFSNNDISNQYLLCDNLIPVKQNNKWGLYNKQGEEILPVEYDSIGCIATSIKDKITNNLLVIPEINAIVICKDKLYGLIDYTGKELIPCATDVMYIVTNAGVNTYYMNYTVENPDAENEDDRSTTYNFNIIEYLVTNGIIDSKDVNNMQENMNTNVVNENVLSNDNNV